MNRARLAKEILKLAKALVADDVDNFIRELKSGNYEWAVIFPGKTRPGKRPKSSFKVDKLDMNRIREVISEVVKMKKTPEALVLTIIGTAGRKDTYVFTHEPYEQVFADKGAQPPKKSVRQIAEEVKLKLREMGLMNLGKRSGKSGEQFGLRDSARRISVGRNYMMLNYLLVEQDVGYRKQNSRWSLYNDFLLSKVTDSMLEKMVQWVKRGPTMKEVRRRVREKAESGVGVKYDIAMSTGLEK